MDELLLVSEGRPAVLAECESKSGPVNWPLSRGDRAFRVKVKVLSVLRRSSIRLELRLLAKLVPARALVAAAAVFDKEK